MDRKVLAFIIGGIVVLTLFSFFLASMQATQNNGVSDFKDFDSLPKEDQNSILELLDQEIKGLDSISIEELNNTLLIQ